MRRCVLAGVTVEDPHEPLHVVAKHLFYAKNPLVTVAMALYSDDWADFEDSAQADSSASAHAAYGAPPLATVQTVSTKVPPSFDGRSSWFAYEEAIDDWCDVTELDAEKRGPALRNRLEGDASVYRTLLDRELLRNAAGGVAYFKRELRPHFVKGN